MGVVPRSIPRRAWWAISVVVLTATSCSSTSTASPTPTDQISVLGCQDVIASQPTPPSDSSTFLGGVALPTGRALQVNSSGNTDAQGTLFAKDALIIRRGASFDLVVPEQWRGRLTLIWGSLGKPTDHLRVPGCRPAQRMPSSSHWAVTDDWLVYPGGYFVSRSACVSVIVRAGQAEQTVGIGVGAACPGQSPPPSPG